MYPTFRRYMLSLLLDFDLDARVTMLSMKHQQHSPHTHYVTTQEQSQHQEKQDHILLTGYRTF